MIVNNELYGLGFAKPLSLCIAVSIAAIPAVSYAKEVNTSASIAASTNQLNALIESALSQDSSRAQYASQSLAMTESGAASATLMDPKLKVGFGGLPVDSFKFDEDPMTNISVGLMQQFERGSTLKLNQRKANQQASGLSLQASLREREVASQMTQLWLELGYLQYAESIIVENQRLMAEMEQFVKTNYSIGKSEAQDLLNTQLQVNKLEEKLQLNHQMQSRIVSQFSEWLGSNWLSNNRSLSASYALNWPALNSILSSHAGTAQYYDQLNQHPMAQMADSNISVNQIQVEMAVQAYTPQFGVEVMYAYRQANNMMGEPASDLVSAYLTMDIPLFTGSRQDKNLAAAQHQVGAAKYQKDTLLAQMNAQANALMNDRVNLQERIERYQQRLLPQATARTQAVERGYQNSTAQFGDVITASSDELALQLEVARLTTDLNITNSKLAALLGGFEYTSPEAHPTHSK
jgi:outer membrane protein TolC